MALVTITSRVDSSDKVNFDNFCDSVGLNACNKSVHKNGVKGAENTL